LLDIEATGLKEQRWEVVRAEELAERVQEILTRIDNVMGLRMGMELIGSRLTRRWLGGMKRGREGRGRFRG
jgi:hypothetical protein